MNKYIEMMDLAVRVLAKKYEEVSLYEETVVVRTKDDIMDVASHLSMWTSPVSLEQGQDWARAQMSGGWKLEVIH